MLLKKLGIVIVLSLLLLECHDNKVSETAVNFINDKMLSIDTTPIVETPIVNNTPDVQTEIADPAIELMLVDVSEREAGASNAIELMFNIPLQPNQDFDRFIITTPKLATPVLSANGKKIQFFGIQPETKYQINVVAGLQANNGNLIAEHSRHNIETRAMQPVVSFKSDNGAILVPGHSDELGIYSINMPEVDLNVYRVKTEKLNDFLSEFKQISTSGAYYYNNKRREEMVEHLYTARIETGGKANQREISKFSIADKKWANDSGVYFATLGKPGSFEFSAATWFSVSAIGLQIRQFPKQTYIITQDIKTGKILPSVKVDLLDSKSRRYASLTSDLEGRITVSKKHIRHLSLIMARKGEQVTILPYQNPRFDLSDFNIGGLQHSDSQLFVYSERDIYRPGESLTLSILRRDADGGVENQALSVAIHEPNGSRYKSVWLNATDKKNGYYEYNLDLPEFGPVGNWEARVSMKGNRQYTASFGFKVEEFLPDRLRLTLGDNGKVQRFTPEQGLAVNVLGEYLYGAPAAGNKLESTMSVSAWNNPFKQWPDYFVGDRDAAKVNNVGLPTATLNKEGEYVSQIKQDWKRWNVPTKVRLNYSLFESGGRAINRHHDSLLWPLDSFVAVKAGFENNQSASNSKIDFNLLRLDKAGNSIGTGDVKVEVIREEKRYFWTYSDDKGWHYQRIEKEYAVDNRTLTFTNQDPLKFTTEVEWGGYRLELTDLATQGKTIYRFTAGEEWYNQWEDNSSTIRPDRVNLALDKASYLPGEKLTLRIGSPTAGNALITIETDSILYQKQFAVIKGESSFTLTVPARLTRHDAYISVFVVAPSNDHDQSVSKRSFGIVHLPLTRDERKIDLSIDVPERWLPNQKVIAKINAKDAQGNPLSGSARVTLSAVDAGVLSVSDYKVEDPYDFFYGQRSYQGALTDIYDQVMTPLLASIAKLRWGGDAALTRGGEKAESEVQIVSLFSGPVIIRNGIAEIPLQLPAFDGELVLTAVAFDQNKFAKAEQAITVSSPVVLQVSMPKFMASGDSSKVVLELTNTTDKIAEGKLELTVDGQVDFQRSIRSITLQPSEKKTINITLKASQDIGEAKIKAELSLVDQDNNEKEFIEREWAIPVRTTQASEFHSKKVLLLPGDDLSLSTDVLKPFVAASKKLQLSVALSPNLDTQAHWQYLVEYPYTCLEQTTSKSRPFASALNGKDFYKAKTALEKANSAIERYSELQRTDGSFGLWSKRSVEQHWLTSYATEYLYDLKAKGIDVPAEMLNQATKRLQSYLSSRFRHNVNTWSSEPKHYDAAYRAYAAYVLAKQNKVTLGPLRDIQEKHLNAAIGKLPGVHLGLAMLMTGSEKEGTALINAALTKKRTNQYLGDYGSQIRDDAMVINALLTTPSVSDELKQKALTMLPQLASDINGEKWLSTQERSALLSLALTMETQYADQSWRGTLNVAGQVEALNLTGEYHQNINLINNSTATFTNQGETPIYASFDWSGVPIKPVYNVNQGIEVSVDHYSVKEGQATKLSTDNTLNSGELLLTRIIVTSDERVPDALLANLMPAGLELENQNLANSLKLADISIDGKKLNISEQIEHQEFREDRYIAALDLPSRGTQTLYVLSRAVNPGVYVVPAVRIESMYKPSVYGVGGSIKQITVNAQP
ncbi:alpha-2-macroglobulin family protein [Psychromonas algicola]|uniref:alpha-2-macroglobulin family protein n=1 Tax=Psychromonas algicola TaxID=2555642 RepID=UPI00141A47D3|nr:alpha-2-macroglobulin [Psychromonas sp. RZ5]